MSKIYMLGQSTCKAPIYMMQSRYACNFNLKLYPEAYRMT